ncbi:cytochrome P450 307a1-like [Brevipalpus obovatus]|uniref:cytochrome P450 307a1-like n=1 Tax=Brevipalpus obovatus TaxID=246614 RepID=UPI003D9E2A86
MSLIFLAAVLLIFYYLAILLDRKLDKNGKAPSPFKFPIIGHLHLMTKYPGESWKAFNEIQEKFGKIVELKLGVQKFLLVADLDAVKEILLTNGKKFANRPYLKSVDRLAPGIENVSHLCSWSNSYKETRQRIFFHTLTSSTSNGVRNRYYGIMARKHEYFLQSLSSGNKRELCLKDLNFLIGSVFFEHLCGKSLMNDCGSFEQFLILQYKFHENSINGSVVDLFPILGRLEIFYKNTTGSIHQLINYLEHDGGLLERRDRLSQEYPSPRGISRNQENPQELEDCFSEDLIRCHFMDPASMSWRKCVLTVLGLLLNVPNVTNITMACLGYLSLDHEVQDEIRSEIKRKIPWNDDIISPDQSMKLVHTKAAMMETLRLISSPYLPHSAIENTSLNGYRVEKGTNVLVNVQYINHSPDLWESPLEFKPSRFLIPSEDGSSVQIRKPSFFLPYSLGCRSCPGFGMFEAQAFFIVANLLRKFQLSTSYSHQEMQKRGLCNFSSMKQADFFSLNLIPLEDS